MLSSLLEAAASEPAWYTSWVNILMVCFMGIMALMALIMLITMMVWVREMYLYNKQCGHQITIEEYLKESNIKYDWKIKNILYN